MSSNVRFDFGIFFCGYKIVLKQNKNTVGQSWRYVGGSENITKQELSQPAQQDLTPVAQQKKYKEK